MMADIETIAEDIVDAAYNVHKEFGPGLLESAYQQCHVYELRKRGRQVLTELKLPIIAHSYGTTDYLSKAQRLQTWLFDKLECEIDQERHG